MKKSFSLMLAVIILSAGFSFNVFAAGGVRDILTYPEEAVTAYDPAFLKVVSGQANYITNRGYDRTSLFVSPDWECEIEGTRVPVWATLTYDGETDTGVLHSFCCVWADAGTNLSIKLISNTTVNSAVVLPLNPVNIHRNTVTFTASPDNNYTCLINDDDISRAITVSVREYTDEDREIDVLRTKYGSENVLVYDKDYYELDYIDTSSVDAVYFKRGAFFSVNHLYDVLSDEDAKNIPDREKFLAIWGRDDFTVAGCGTVDFTKADFSELGDIEFFWNKKGSASGLICLNPNAWTITTYADENVNLRDILVFGYRTNSDGINICGCKNMVIENCFIRTGDDCFSVQTTNTEYAADAVTFIHCSAMSSKARCFGITGEAYAPISNITFRDCTVCHRNATWSDNVCSLSVTCDNEKNVNVSNILFENIYIHKDTGRPIVVKSASRENGISDVVFKNVAANAAMKGRIPITTLTIEYQQPQFDTQQQWNWWQKFCSFICSLLNSLGLNETADKIKTKVGLTQTESYITVTQTVHHTNVVFDNVTVNGTIVHNDNLIHYFDAE